MKSNIHQYTIFGTEIRSDIPFPLQLPSSSQTRYMLTLSSDVPSFFHEAISCGFLLYRAHGRSVRLYSNREFAGESFKDQPWCYEVEGVGSFYWKGGGGSIYYDFGESPDTHLLSFWFIHLMLPFFFALEKRYEMFHGGAVLIEGKAVMFCAPSMGGKSTMTDYFIQKEHTLISDDKIPMIVENGQFMLTGSHPYHRPYRKFEDLGYRVSDFLDSYLPLHAMYILEKSEHNAPITIEEVRGFGKFNAMLPHYLFSFPSQKQYRMTCLSKLLNKIRVFRVYRPWNISRLSEVYTSIVEHSKTL